MKAQWNRHPNNPFETLNKRMQSELPAEKISSHIKPSNYDIQTGEANARLIAAAPDLLNACKMALSTIPEIVRFGSDDHLLHIALERAIAEAEGRS